jgi:spermidine synthase
VASDTVNARSLTSEAAAQRLRERRISGLKYYNAELHPALFALPTFVRDLTGTEPARAPARLAA